MGSSKTDRSAKLAKLAEGLASTCPKEDVVAAVDKRLEANRNKLQTELMSSISDPRERVSGVPQQVDDLKASQDRVESLDRDWESTLDLVTKRMAKQSGEVRFVMTKCQGTHACVAAVR